MLHYINWVNQICICDHIVFCNLIILIRSYTSSINCQSFYVLENYSFLELNIGKSGAVWYMCLNTCFQFLNNITCIFTYFFTYTYFQKIQTKLLKQYYQIAPISQPMKKGNLLSTESEILIPNLVVVVSENQ